MSEAVPRVLQQREALGTRIYNQRMRALAKGGILRLRGLHGVWNKVITKHVAYAWCDKHPVEDTTLALLRMGIGRSIRINSERMGAVGVPRYTRQTRVGTTRLYSSAVTLSASLGCSFWTGTRQDGKAGVLVAVVCTGRVAISQRAKHMKSDIS